MSFTIRLCVRSFIAFGLHFFGNCVRQTANFGPTANLNNLMSVYCITDNKHKVMNSALSASIMTSYNASAVSLRPMTVKKYVLLEVPFACVCWSSVATLKLQFHFDVTGGPAVVVEVTWKIPTSFHHFSQSDSIKMHTNTIFVLSAHVLL